MPVVCLCFVVEPVVFAAGGVPVVVEICCLFCTASEVPVVVKICCLYCQWLWKSVVCIACAVPVVVEICCL